MLYCGKIHDVETQDLLIYCSTYSWYCHLSPQLLLPTGVTIEVTVVNIVSAGHVFVQQHTHPTYHALRSLDQQMSLCYSQPGTPALPSPAEGKSSRSLCFCCFSHSVYTSDKKTNLLFFFIHMFSFQYR